MSALLARHARRAFVISPMKLRLGSQAFFSTDVEDTLVWPPPEMEANPALQRLVQAQTISQKMKKPVQAGQSGNFFDSISNRRQEKNVQKQKDPEQAAPKSGGRVAQLVRSLLAARDTGPTRIDKESIEKLRVVDLRQLLAVLDHSRSGLKSSLVDRAWEAVKHDLVSTWRTEPSGRVDSRADIVSEATQGETSQAKLPFSHVVTGSEVAEILKDSKTDDVTVLDVRPRQCDFTDEMVIATARSKLHCQSAAQAVVYRARLFHSHDCLVSKLNEDDAKHKLKQSCKEIAPGIPPRIEGLGASHHANSDWLVVDCGSVIAHIFDGHEARAQYDLDSLWAAPPATGLEREPSGSSSHAVQSMS